MFAITFPLMKNLENFSCLPNRNISAFSTIESANRNLLGIIQQEVILLEDLCTMLEIPNWKRKCEHITEHDEMPFLGNVSELHILPKFMEQNNLTNLDGFRDTFGNNLYILHSEVFSQDFGAICGTSNSRVFVTFDENGEYIGHIYGHFNSCNDMECIGIRTSIVNSLSKILKLNTSVYGVGTFILQVIDAYSIKEGLTDFFLSDPIGSMPKIALNYGFDKFYRLPPGRTPPEINLTIL